MAHSGGTPRGRRKPSGSLRYPRVPCWSSVGVFWNLREPSGRPPAVVRELPWVLRDASGSCWRAPREASASYSAGLRQTHLLQAPRSPPRGPQEPSWGPAEASPGAHPPGALSESRLSGNPPGVLRYPVGNPAGPLRCPSDIPLREPSVRPVGGLRYPPVIFREPPAALQKLSRRPPGVLREASGNTLAHPPRREPSGSSPVSIREASDIPAGVARKEDFWFLSESSAETFLYPSDIPPGALRQASAGPPVSPGMPPVALRQALRGDLREAAGNPPGFLRNPSGSPPRAQQETSASSPGAMREELSEHCVKSPSRYLQDSSESPPQRLRYHSGILLASPPVIAPAFPLVIHPVIPPVIPPISLRYPSAISPASLRNLSGIPPEALPDSSGLPELPPRALPEALGRSPGPQTDHKLALDRVWASPGPPAITPRSSIPSLPPTPASGSPHPGLPLIYLLEPSVMLRESSGISRVSAGSALGDLAGRSAGGFREPSGILPVALPT